MPTREPTKEPTPPPSDAGAAVTSFGVNYATGLMDNPPRTFDEHLEFARKAAERGLCKIKLWTCDDVELFEARAAVQGTGDCMHAMLPNPRGAHAEHAETPTATALQQLSEAMCDVLRACAVRREPICQRVVVQKQCGQLRTRPASRSLDKVAQRRGCEMQLRQVECHER